MRKKRSVSVKYDEEHEVRSVNRKKKFTGSMKRDDIRAGDCRSKEIKIT